MPEIQNKQQLSSSLYKKIANTNTNKIQKN
jgi:hypothetical protein